jgi:hypothetical protein
MQSTEAPDLAALLLDEVSSLSWVLSDRQEAKALEIGTGFGVTARRLSAIPGVSVVTMDVERSFEHAGPLPDGVTFVKGGFLDREVVEEVRSQGPYDLILFDAWGSYADLVHLWYLYWPMLKPSGCFALHDIDFGEGARFWSESTHFDHCLRFSPAGNLGIVVPSVSVPPSAESAERKVGPGNVYRSGASLDELAAVYTPPQPHVSLQAQFMGLGFRYTDSLDESAVTFYVVIPGRDGGYDYYDASIEGWQAPFDEELVDGLTRAGKRVLVRIENVDASYATQHPLPGGCVYLPFCPVLHETLKKMKLDSHLVPHGVDADVMVDPQLPRVFDFMSHGYDVGSDLLFAMWPLCERENRRSLHLGVSRNYLRSRVDTLPSDLAPVIPYAEMRMCYGVSRFSNGMQTINGFEIGNIEAPLCGTVSICLDQPIYRYWFDETSRFVTRWPRAVSDKEGIAAFQAEVSAVFDSWEPVSEDQKTVIRDTFGFAAVRRTIERII